MRKVSPRAIAGYSDARLLGQLRAAMLEVDAFPEDLERLRRLKALVHEKFIRVDFRTRGLKP